MNIPSIDIKDILISSSVAEGAFGTDLFISTMPDSPSTCTCLFDHPSWHPPESNYTMEYPSLQILNRGAKGAYVTASAKAKSIYDELHALTYTTQGGSIYKSIVADSIPFFIGNDEKGRPLFSCNYRLTRQST